MTWSPPSRPGVTLDELARVLARAGQRLALDPPGQPAGGTVGGVLATNVAGPLRLRYGAPRDLLIGITVVRADGTVARSGGKVVKNVAGYDLGKLFAGSRGTLGLITQATFRLHPLPAADLLRPRRMRPRTPACACSPRPGAAGRPGRRRTRLGAAGRARPPRVALEGDAGRRYPARGAAVRPDPGCQGRRQAAVWWGSPPCWRSGHSRGHRAAGRLLGRRPDRRADRDRNRRPAGRPRPAVAGSAAAGVLHVAAPRRPTRTRSRASSPACEPTKPGHPAKPAATASVVVLHAPSARSRGDSISSARSPALAVMRAVKQQFDPDRMMSPGRFAGGL